MIFYIFYAGLGKLFIFLIQKSPYMKFIIGFFRGRSRVFLEELFGCNLCLGFWVYLALALLFQYANVNINVLDIPNAPLISAIITGAITSFAVHVFSTGWKDLFGTFEIGG
jgi:hypothetical protein